MPQSGASYSPINAPTYFQGSFQSRLIGQEELLALTPLVERLRSPSGALDALFEGFDIHANKSTWQTLTRLESAIKDDIRINTTREFFYHRGALRAPPGPILKQDDAQMNDYLTEVDQEAHIAGVGEVLLLLQAQLLKPTVRGIYAPVPAFNGHAPAPHTWMQISTISNPQKKRPLLVNVVDDVNLRKGQFVLFVRAHRVPMGIEARRVYQLHDTAASDKKVK